MNQFALIRSRRFLPLFCTQFLGAFNDNVFRFALIIFVTFDVAERTGADTRMLVVMTGAIFILPFFLFSSLAGQIADKYEKARLIRIVKTTEILVMGLGAIGFWVAEVWFLLSVLFLMGTQSAFFGPLKYGILPQHLDERELTGGNGLIQMGTYVAILVGGMAGGMLAAVDEGGPLLIVVAVVGLAALGRVCAGFIPAAPAGDATLVLDANLPRSTARILGTVLRDVQVLTLVLLISWFWFVGATFLSMVPTFGKELLHADELSVTLLNAAFTIGIGSGSLLVERFSRGRIELGLVPFAALGITLFSADVLLGGTPQPPADKLTMTSFFAYPPALRVFIDLTLIGFCGALYIVPLYAAMLARVDSARCSRTLAALNISNAAFMVASAFFTMALYWLGATIPMVFGAIAALNAVVMLGGMVVLEEFRQRARGIGLDLLNLFKRSNP